ncbi:hypothetical protein QCA50_007827 [Cerrena zonata]|uniref:Uncharacterized protein n=1 Tax=Cerrena zonata TaxID=2478898 RepID=A0AAW0G718_9APHY
MSKRKQTQRNEPEGQTRISSFFSSPSKSQSLVPRSSSPIDLTLDSDESEAGPPSKKRVKTTSGFFTPSPSKQRHNAPPRVNDDAGTTERYRFDPSSANAGNGVEYDASQRKRRERAKKILLGSRNIFAHNDENVSGPSPSDDDGEDEPAPQREVPREDSDTEEDLKFIETISFFMNPKAKGKGKAKSSTEPLQ